MGVVRVVKHNMFILLPLLWAPLMIFFHFVGSTSSRVVTLDSIDIFTTHEWLPMNKPTVYFHCNGDNKTYLLDVKEPNAVYTFKGEESWQVSQVVVANR
jgi:hypothetical protein